ncbi:MAG: hypothetical protein HYZ49_11880 [Chloroflexi bacterium]|nr:hypothetical protein [Chloroflexota bacterium]
MRESPIKTVLVRIRAVRFRHWGTLVELALIAFVAWLIARPLLNFDPARRLPGNEYQTHVGVIAPFIQALKNGTDFPLWNATAGTGRSLIADPFLFVFNPFLSLPMLIWGVINGSKVAVALNFGVAGLGAWVMARQLGFQAVTRLWCGLLYMLSGAIVSHLPVGQLQLSFALGWLPWSVASILWVGQSRSYTALVLAALAQAMFFFAGNLYYQLYGLASILIIVAINAVEWSATPSLNVRAGLRYLAAGLLALGLIALQLFPQLASRGAIRNDGGFGSDVEVEGSQKPADALLNYIVSDHDFYVTSLLGKAPYIQESYRYVGVSPFLFALFLAPAFRRGRRKQIVAFGLCFLLMLAWADLNHSFVKEIYRALPLLFQFRWPGRALSVGGLFLIFLGAFGLDELLASLRSSQTLLSIFTAPGQQQFVIRLGPLLSSLVVVGAGLAVNDVYQAHKEMVSLSAESSPDGEDALRWLRENDPGPYGISTALAVTENGSITGYELGLRLFSIVDGWRSARATQQIGQEDAISLPPTYWVILNTDLPGLPNADLLQTFDSVNVWRNRDSFPYAFYLPVDRARAQTPIALADVTAAPVARRDGPNRLLVEMEGEEASLLVVSEAWFSGWQVWVDDRRADLTTVSTALNVYFGFEDPPLYLTFPASLMAVQVSPGRHKVVFQFESPAFKVGLALSAATLLISALLIWADVRRVRASKAKPSNTPTIPDTGLP